MKDSSPEVQPETALAHIDSGALTPSNPSFARIVARFGWRPDTLTRRIEAALPAVVEQRLYLRIAETVRIRPESFATILRTLLAPGETLQDRDMLDVSVGPNLKVNKFERIAELLVETLNVSHVMAAYYGLSIGNAARLCRALGPDHVEPVAESLLCHCNLEAGTRRAAIALGWLATIGLDLCEAIGAPYPNDCGDWLRSIPGAEYSLARRIGREGWLK